MIGKAMRSVQFCRPLVCVFDELYSCLSSEGRNVSVTGKAEPELLCALMSLPVHYMEKRAQIGPAVGCLLVGVQNVICLVLTTTLAGAATLSSWLDVFGGVGGLMKAAQLIGLQPQGLILIDSDPLCQMLLWIRAGGG